MAVCEHLIIASMGATGGKFIRKAKENGRHRRSEQFTGADSSCGHHLTDPHTSSELLRQYAELTGALGPAAECHFP